ncbi:hypothetical protein [Aureibacter tunicatorum]|uniref:SusE outer membrane protein domain-containing protein n=1 Tax=Aureibacter tunicatorum TaxID=866807 RepID=A0AAE4BSU7_9BACT|nr:hypothetical protein [Aureibacter tunicatorum]MDR6241569.1 hypothetical protein [Aureibacter tunicatorum]BDD07207.1 hypothetical protein AUTU_46900 [Aureibacter tunicatorum]
MKNLIYSILAIGAIFLSSCSNSDLDEKDTPSPVSQMNFNINIDEVEDIASASRSAATSSVSWWGNDVSVVFEYQIYNANTAVGTSQTVESKGVYYGDVLTIEPIYIEGVFDQFELISAVIKEDASGNIVANIPQKGSKYESFVSEPLAHKYAAANGEITTLNLTFVDNTDIPLKDFGYVGFAIGKDEIITVDSYFSIAALKFDGTDWVSAADSVIIKDNAGNEFTYLKVNNSDPNDKDEFYEIYLPSTFDYLDPNAKSFTVPDDIVLYEGGTAINIHSFKDEGLGTVEYTDGDPSVEAQIVDDNVYTIIIK